ncbi:MAG: hypothetical protein ABW019_07315 [Chitinophagaceae bacterium]
MKAIPFVLFCLLFACCRPANKHDDAVITIPAVSIASTDPDLQWKNGLYYYRQRPFSGHIIDRYEDAATRQDRSFYEGREEGWQLGYYPNGKPAEKRYYRHGEKDSVHTGWWPGGNLRFEYHFSNGNYHGDFKEWYAGGQPYKHLHYTHGTDDSGKGWRENGKVYMSYVTRDGRRYGLINANLCYSLAGEEAELVKSIADSIVLK